MDNRLNSSQNRFDNVENVAGKYTPFWEDSEEESDDEDEDTSIEDDGTTTKRCE